MAPENSNSYIHGTRAEEQHRLAKLNDLTNHSFVEFVQIHESDKVLELGSGLGILAEEISNKLTSGKVTGVEISAEQIARCPCESPRLGFVRGDVHKLFFKDHFFDVVYCRYILEHVNDPLKVLHEAYRVLKPGGRIFIQENAILLIEFFPDCPVFKLVWKAFAEYQSTIGGDAMIGIRLYDLLKRTGFVNPELSIAPEVHYHEKGTLTSWIDNLIGNLQGGAEALTGNKFIEPGQYDEALRELQDFKKNENASCYFYWNRGRASKPV
jgi:ubiquinone/menaquinone biosynthesis C-methylase UbiE